MTVRYHLATYQRETEEWEPKSEALMSVSQFCNRVHRYANWDNEEPKFENQDGELVELEAGALAYALTKKEKGEQIQIIGVRLGQEIKVSRN